MKNRWERGTSVVKEEGATFSHQLSRDYSRKNKELNAIQLLEQSRLESIKVHRNLEAREGPHDATHMGNRTTVFVQSTLAFTVPCSNRCLLHGKLWVYLQTG